MAFSNHTDIPVPQVLGSTQVLTPVRRSARKLEGGKKAEGGAEALLEVTNYSYVGNPQLQGAGPEAAQGEGRGDSAQQ
jgi:hypothetical protein